MPFQVSVTLVCSATVSIKKYFRLMWCLGYTSRPPSLLLRWIHTPNTQLLWSATTCLRINPFTKRLLQTMLRRLRKEERLNNRQGKTRLLRSCAVKLREKRKRRPSRSPNLKKNLRQNMSTKLGQLMKFWNKSFARSTVGVRKINMWWQHLVASLVSSWSFAIQLPSSTLNWTDQ